GKAAGSIQVEAVVVGPHVVAARIGVVGGAIEVPAVGGGGVAGPGPQPGVGVSLRRRHVGPLARKGHYEVAGRRHGQGAGWAAGVAQKLGGRLAQRLAG
nr:hypothetical protein [Tanacetum cinerariifolium]